MGRLISRFRRHGSEGLISRRIGMRPNNAIPESVRQNIMTIISRNYSDFGPTLACGYLRDSHGITVSAETLRKWMTDEGLWKPRRKRRARIHPLRERRARRGELVQIDGTGIRGDSQYNESGLDQTCGSCASAGRICSVLGISGGVS